MKRSAFCKSRSWSKAGAALFGKMYQVQLNFEGRNGERMILLEQNVQDDEY